MKAVDAIRAGPVHASGMSMETPVHQTAGVSVCGHESGQKASQELAGGWRRDEGGRQGGNRAARTRKRAETGVLRMLILTIGDLYVPERAIDIPAKFRKLLQPRGKIDKVLCLGNITSSRSTLEFLKNISADFQMVRGEFDDDLSLPQSLVFTYDNLKIGLLNGFQVIPKNDPLSLLNHARMMDADVLIYGSTHKVEAYTLDGKFFVNPGTGTGAYSTDSLDKEDRMMISKLVADKQGAGSAGGDGAVVGAAVRDGESRDPAESEGPAERADGASDALQPQDADRTPPKTSSNSPSDTENTADDSGPAEASKPAVSPDLVPPSLDELQLHSIDEYMEPFPSFCLLDVKDSTCTLYLYTLVDGEVKIDKLVYAKEQ